MSQSNRIPNPAIRFFDEAGTLFLNVWDSVRFIARGAIDWKKVITQTALVGFDSLGMSILICVIMGSVLALQTAEKFAQSGTDSYVGGLVALAVVRELAPIFTCLAVGARAGTAIAAEIANMQVNDQVDALRVLGVNPIRYLMVPRLLACVFALPMLTLVGEVAAIVGGMLVAQAVTGLHYHMYLESVWLFLRPNDIRVSLLKAVTFGIILAAISCTVGLQAQGSARAVGHSTTKAVIWTAISIIITDFFLTWIFFGSSYEGN